MCLVLIVDDKEERRSRIQWIVKDVVPGCEVNLIETMEDAEAWLEEHHGEPLDLAIVDLFLRGEPPEDPGDGTELIGQIRAGFADCPCILISGYEPLDVLRRRLPESRGLQVISLHHTAQSMWGQLRQAISDALVAQAAAAGSLS